MADIGTGAGASSKAVNLAPLRVHKPGRGRRSMEERGEVSVGPMGRACDIGDSIYFIQLGHLFSPRRMTLCAQMIVREPERQLDL